VICGKWEIRFEPSNETRDQLPADPYDANLQLLLEHQLLFVCIPSTSTEIYAYAQDNFYLCIVANIKYEQRRTCLSPFSMLSPWKANQNCLTYHIRILLALCSMKATYHTIQLITSNCFHYIELIGPILTGSFIF
jgi:hypothetical protein